MNIGAMLGLTGPSVQQFPLYSKVDRIGLARYVTTDATRWISTAQSSFDQDDTSTGRTEIVRSIYEELLSKGIHYDKEPYHPHHGVQIIRTPGELLEHPKRGTCIDLSLLLCGLAMGFGLLPVIVIARGHAFILINVADPLEKWNSLGRKGKALFAEGLLTCEERPNALEMLTDLMRSQDYIAIECTGVAASGKLAAATDDRFPELGGRSADGKMTFDEALKAGEKQFIRVKEDMEHQREIKTQGAGMSLEASREFLYAVDIASAHYGWNISPFPLPQQPSQISIDRARRFGKFLAFVSVAIIGIMYAVFQYNESKQAKANRLESAILSSLAPDELSPTIEQYGDSVSREVATRLNDKVKSRATGADGREHIRLARERSRAWTWLSLFREELPLKALAYPSEPAALLTRSYLIRELPISGISFELLMECTDSTDAGVRQAALLAAAEFDLSQNSRRKKLLEVTRQLYVNDDDPGVHAAAWWALSNRLGQEGQAALGEEFSKITKGLQRLKGKSEGSYHWFIEPKCGITMICIPANSQFVMGDDTLQSDGQVTSGAELAPTPRKVMIPRAFAISMTEITEAQFQRSGLSGDGKYPYGTEYGQACSWQTAAAFCNFLSPDERERCYRAVEDGSLGYVDFGKQRYEPAGADHITKTGFRLPTECEWEFVCRGMIGTNKGARYCFGSDPQLLSDYASIHGYRLQVASKKPNCFGLFDIHGGLAEWCDDNARPYHANLGARPFEDVGVSIEHQQANGKMRILRGGDFFGSESSVAVQRRSSEMQFSRPSVRWGLRVACTIPGFPKANDLNVGRVK